MHKESIVHCLTYFKDGSVKASLGVSDMRIPIAYALTYPKRLVSSHPLDLTTLTFKPMDFDRFPLLALAYHVGRQGGLLPTVMHAANEAAVKLFLEEKITFLGIEEIIIRTVRGFKNKENPSLEEILETDQAIQQSIIDYYEKR